jgi:hypothetical protein
LENKSEKRHERPSRQVSQSAPNWFYQQDEDVSAKSVIALWVLYFWNIGSGLIKQLVRWIVILFYQIRCKSPLRLSLCLSRCHLLSPTHPVKKRSISTWFNLLFPAAQGLALLQRLRRLLYVNIVPVIITIVW